MPKTTERDYLRRLRGTARGKLTRKCNLLTEQVRQGCSSEIIEACYDEIKEAFRELERRHEVLVGKLCEGDEEDKECEDKLREEEEYIVQAESMKSQAYEKLLIIRKQEREERQKAAQTANTVKVKVKPIEPPKFEGDICQYQTFRSNYQTIMTDNYGKNAFALYQCLSGEALNLVHGVEDDFDEMFRRLDQRYADPVRLTDCVIDQLKRLKPIPESNTARFIETVEIIEKCWTDMKRNKLEEQMSTVMVISLIEKILPSQQKREWTKKYQNLSNRTNAFPTLLDYLKEEKELLDYMDKDVRNSTRSAKAAIHSVEVKEEESYVMKTLQRMQTQQAEHLANVESLLHKFTQAMMTGGPATLQPSQNRHQSNFCWYHNSDSHTINRCIAFHNLEPSIKMDVLKRNHICFHCLGKGHNFKDCLETRTCYMKLGNGNVCGKPHHPKIHYLLHPINNHEVNININKTECYTLLMIGQVNCKDRNVVTLFDPGSTNSLITHRKARELGLCGIPYTITMTTVGKVCDTVSTKLYTVPLVDESGAPHTLQCVGIDDITADIRPVHVSRILHLLDIQSSADVSRPHGKVELLIGADNCNIIPVTIKTVGKLQLMKGPFGYCIRGSHPELEIEGTRYYTAQVNHVALTPGRDEVWGETGRTLKEELDYFLSIDHLGTNCRPRCSSCSKCKDCNSETNMTVKEEEEMKLILNGLEYKERERVWIAHYPWIKDPQSLPNNFGIALMKLKGTEKRLRKAGKGRSGEYHQQIVDMLRRGVARKLTREEVDQYEGPVHYLSHHDILKPGSGSTPTRIVFNASASYNGHALNDYWAKGPNVLNNLFGLLLRFRENPSAFVGDISKMFNSIRLSAFDSQVHRFLWRNFEDRAPDHYILTAVPFGDICSPAVAVLAMRQTAEKYKEEFPRAANIVLKDTYMDDIIHSTNCPGEAQEARTDIEFILKQGNFQVKGWTISGESQGESNVDLSGISGGKVLGVIWHPLEDEIGFKMKLNNPKQKHHLRERADILEDEPPKELTKRQLLSQISTIFDPMGFVTPVTLSGKLLMRQIIQYTDEKGKKLDWDDPLPEDFKERWVKFLQNVFRLETIKVPRCIRTTQLIEPALVLFNDASTLAYSACAYARWQVGEDKYESRLLASKARLAPIKAQTIPKLELSSAVLSVRLRNTIVKESNINFNTFYHLTDSEIVLAQMAKESINARTYVANRISEIKESTSRGEWHWISTGVNIADIMTRPNPFVDVGPDSNWQCGPDFLKLPKNKWPTKSTPLRPEGKVIINTAELTDTVVEESQMFDISRFQSYRKLIRVTARIVSACRNRSFKSISLPPTVDQMKHAETLWIKHAQIPLQKNWQVRFKRLGPFCKDGILYVGSRIASWMKNNYNNEAFVLLPTKHRLSDLCIKDAHDRDHEGVESTLCKLQAKFWIPQARKLIRSTKSRCVICRKLERKIIGQSMGPVPEERLKPSPAFYHAALDLFGPLMIKDTVKGRCKKKVYGVVINCLSTRASYVDLVEGYDADGLITTLRRFMAIRGTPRSMYSDRGSQLKLVSKEICQMTHDHHKLSNFGREAGMEWSFTKSADAPWENGCTEAMVKLVKRVLTKTIGNATLTFGELQSVLFEVANILNERPIGMKSGSSNVSGSYLCPNDLLLGRASVRVPEGLFDNNANIKSRQNFINTLVNSFWRKWMIYYFPTLIIQQKWHCERRNLRIGDIVLVQDSNAIKGSWKLAEVCEVYSSSDGKIRDVQLRYKIQKGNGEYEGQADMKVKRSVHKLVLILPVEEQ